MSDILFHYERVSPTSWAYFSSFLMLALFFKFNRFFSIRNVDLFLLIALAPGLLLVQYSYDADGISDNALEIQQLGFQWLLAVGILFLIRLLIDPAGPVPFVIEGEVLGQLAAGHALVELGDGEFAWAKAAVSAPVEAGASR